MKKYAKYPALAVTLAIMAVIFVLSSQPAELSTKVSRAVTETVQASRIKAITPLWFSTTNLNANVRKWAHVYIYCALGVSMAVTVQLWLHRVTLRQKALLHRRYVCCTRPVMSSTSILCRAVPRS